MACVEHLTKMHRKTHCVLTSNGTCALTIALMALEDNRHKVILPAIICPSVYFAIYYAGKTPVAADINLPYGDISAVSVEELLKQGDVCAVVGAHLFGNSFDTISLRFLCNTNGAVLIEDTAQALGGSFHDDMPFGASGDITILSFGHTKIVDIGNGGAVLCDDDVLYKKIIALEDSLAPIHPQQEIILNNYRTIYYALWNAGKAYSGFYALFQGVEKIVKQAHIYKKDNIDEEQLLKSLISLPEIVNERHILAKVYLDELADEKNIIPLYNTKVGVPWRFSCLVPENKRDKLVASVRRKGFDISTWYPSVHRWIAEDVTLPEHALEFEKRIINLWVTPQYKNDIPVLAECIRKSVR